MAPKIIDFLTGLSFTIPLNDDIQVMNPFSVPEVVALCKQFYKKYYSDNHKRHMIIGINPGRFGGGITGIPFTDPIRLQFECEIENNWPKKQELSSVFIYEMIKAFGGPEMFYNNFYITAVSPLGFTRHQKNLNYYDDKIFQQNIKPFVISCMEKQLAFGIHTNAAFCLGEGKNFQYLSKLNQEMKWFDQVVPLAHPRFIMQYRLKKKAEYIALYLSQFKKYISAT